jgi:enoyl-CoA hydratase/carnithine racemase
MTDRLRCTVDAAGVAHVRFTRPERMNALDRAAFDAILAVQQQLAADAQVRVVVLSGEGRSFCAGLDVAELQRMAAGDMAPVVQGPADGARAPLVERTHGLANWAQQVVWGWRELPVPVLAALHGSVFGGGLQIALGADLRLAAADTQLSVLELAWGLVPDMGGMVLMRELLRGDVMRELVYSARVLPAAEALQLGLVTRVVDDPLAQALADAARLARRSPSAVRAAKRLLNAASAGATPAELLLAEAREQQALIGSDEQREVVRLRLAQLAAR